MERFNDRIQIEFSWAAQKGNLNSGKAYVRHLSSLLLSLWLPVFSSSLVPSPPEPVVNFGGIILYTWKYMKSPERLLLIKGQWDGELLWWTLNRAQLRCVWQKRTEKSAPSPQSIVPFPLAYHTSTLSSLLVIFTWDLLYFLYQRAF